MFLLQKYDVAFALFSTFLNFSYRDELSFFFRLSIQLYRIYICFILLQAVFLISDSLHHQKAPMLLQNSDWLFVLHGKRLPSSFMITSSYILQDHLKTLKNKNLKERKQI